MSDIKRQDFDFISINYTDVADGGGDYLASLIGVLMNGECYLVDVCYTKLDSDYTHPTLVSKYKKWDIRRGIFESNNQGAQYTKNFKKELIANEMNDFTKRVAAIQNSQNKHSRIIIQAPWIINNMHFLDDEEIINMLEYRLYLKHLCEYMKDKPSPPDDAPDATAGLSILAQKFR